MEHREYERRVLEAYCATPGTVGVIRRADRSFAAQLHDRGVPLATVENALTLAVARRSARPVDAVPSRHDPFTGVLRAGDRRSTALKVGPEYFQHLRNKLRRSTPAR